jgi:hypothetical protein
MKWIVVLLAVSIALSLWLVFGVDDPETVDDRGIEGTGPRPLPELRTEQPIVAEGTEAPDPQAIAGVMAGTLDVPVKSGALEGPDLLKVLRARTRVVFRPATLEERFKGARFDVIDELELFEERRALGADYVRIMIENGYLVDDHAGVMVITEGIPLER